MPQSDTGRNQPAQKINSRMIRRRKGMVIKNTDAHAVVLQLATRRLVVKPGEEVPISADEVKDSVLREKLQARAISIVRPITEAEENAVRQLLETHADSKPSATTIG